MKEKQFTLSEYVKGKERKEKRQRNIKVVSVPAVRFAR